MKTTIRTASVRDDRLRDDREPPGSTTATVMYSLSRLSITSPINLPQGELHSYRVQVPTYNYSGASQITEYRAFLVGSGCAPSDAITVARRSVAPSLVLFLEIPWTNLKLWFASTAIIWILKMVCGCFGNANFFPRGSSVDQRSLSSLLVQEVTAMNTDPVFIGHGLEWREAQIN